MGDYDRSSKWLVEHHGDALPRLAGLAGIRSWSARQAEVVQPGQLPDGLLEAYFEGSAEPEIITFILHPKGQFEVPERFDLASRLGWTELRLRWRVVTLWELNAEDLLATQDPGMVPWVPLTRFEGPLEPVFRRCREIIDRHAAPEEQVNLLAVTQVLARLRYNDPQLLAVLGGWRIMIESP